MNYYNKEMLVAFNDLREIIQEEVAKVVDAFKNTNPKPKPLSIAQVAERYNVSKATVHNWMKQDIIQGFKMGKGRFFAIKELEENLTRYKHLEALEKNGLIPPRKKIW